MASTGPIGTQLVALKGRLGLSLEKIAKAAGYAGRSSVQRYFDDQYEGPLPAEVAVALARGLAGKGTPPVTADEFLRLSVAGELAVTTNDNEEFELPIEGVVAAGIWRVASDERSHDFPPMEVGPPPFRGAKRMGLRMEGPSMDLTIPDGSDLEVLWITLGDVEPEPGDLVVVERRRHDMIELTCKRLAVEGGELVLRCESSRPEYQEVMRVGRPDPDVFTDDETRIVGIVLSHSKRHNRRAFLPRRTRGVE